MYQLNNKAGKFNEFQEVSIARLGGKRAETAAGHPVTRRPTQNSPSISSISCSSSLVFHHQKYFSAVTQPAASRSNVRRALSRARSRATLAAERPQGSGLRTRARGAGRGDGGSRPSNSSPRKSARARDWSAVDAAMTSETGVRSAPRLAPKHRLTAFVHR